MNRSRPPVEQHMLRNLKGSSLHCRWARQVVEDSLPLHLNRAKAVLVSLGGSVQSGKRDSSPCTGYILSDYHRT